MYIDAFKKSMREHGIITTAPIIEDAKLHRFYVEGDKQSAKNGWYVFYPNANPVAVFGYWKTGLKYTWCAKAKNQMSSSERNEYLATVKAAKKAYEQERFEKDRRSRVIALRMWNESTDSDGEHRYLKNKGVKAYGIRIDKIGRLVIPVRGIADELQSLQFIHPNGDKEFLSGGTVKGGYFDIGELTETIMICEGYATGASIHEATGLRTTVAFNATNLSNVANNLRKKYPRHKFTICADDDKETINNPGITTALNAAKAISATVKVPDFSAVDRSGKPTDFNDLMSLSTLSEVRRQIIESRDVMPIKSSSIKYRQFSTIESKPINWLWMGYIARGKVSIIAGDPGLGKSQITANIAAIVTNGGEWPLNGGACAKGSVVFISAEDDPADTIRPRLEAVGADLSRVSMLDAVVDEITDAGVERQFNLKTDIIHLGELLDELGDVSLIIIDPISAYLGQVDSHKNSDIRALLAPLSRLASEREVAILCVSHLNKATGQSSLMRVTGSLAFVAAARSAFLVAYDKANDRKVFVPLKNNIACDTTGLSFSIESVQLLSGIETSKVVWGKESVIEKADDLMGSRLDVGGGISAIQEAKDFLADYLSTGKQPSVNVIKDAMAEGISETTLRRAKKEMDLLVNKVGFGPNSQHFWGA